jgi:hypothetical protein
MIECLLIIPDVVPDDEASDAVETAVNSAEISDVDSNVFVGSADSIDIADFDSNNLAGSAESVEIANVDSVEVVGAEDGRFPESPSMPSSLRRALFVMYLSIADESMTDCVLICNVIWLPCDPV